MRLWRVPGVSGTKATQKNTFFKIGVSLGRPHWKRDIIRISKGCFTYTPNPNRKRTETVTATELHRFVFGRPFTYEPNPWTKSKKMSV